MAKQDNSDNLYDLDEQFAPRNGRKHRRNRTLVKWLWISFLSLGFLILFLMLLIYNGVIGYMPPIEELEDPHDKLASLVYASDDSELGRYYYGSGNRGYTDYNGISPHVINALVATEDVRFREHSGIDFKALGRTAIKTFLMGDKSSGGASTITQQLAKQLYSEPSSNLLKRALQKPIEWMIAVKLERFYTKDEIINMYLNRFDFLNNGFCFLNSDNAEPLAADTELFIQSDFLHPNPPSSRIVGSIHTFRLQARYPQSTLAFPNDVRTCRKPRCPHRLSALLVLAISALLSPCQCTPGSNYTCGSSFRSWQIPYDSTPHRTAGISGGSRCSLHV